MSAVQTVVPRRLSSLLAGIGAVGSDEDCAVSDITLDSREVQPGSCFIALRGRRENAFERYAADARAQGAVAIVTEDPSSDETHDIPVIRVPALRAKLGELANRFFDTPSATVRVFAVTGTNGKTTVAHLAAQALGQLDRPCGYIGTLGAGVPDVLEPGPNTTPDVITINRWLARFRSRGLTAATLEASSHALDQGRLDGVSLHAAAFTNLGHDHLDYHGDLDHYARSKRRLFEQPGLRAAVVNVDDPVGAALATDLRTLPGLWTCSARGEYDAQRLPVTVRAENIELGLDGLHFELRTLRRRDRIVSRLVGRFNVDNLLLIAGLLLAAGCEADRIAGCLARLHAVPGRMEYCGQSARGAHVFVDFAHTPDGLSAALGTLREVAPGRLCVAFGCGGNRDRAKRPLMAAAVERHADYAIVTADNPRDETTASIAEQIVSGFSTAMNYRVIDDRAAAIRTAIAEGAAGDIVLIAGKGHETVQESAGRSVPFSDREQIRMVLRAES